MVKPVLICVPRRMAYYQPGAAGPRRHTEILLGAGRNSFDGWFPTGIYTGYVSGFSPELINLPSDLVYRFGLLCVFNDDTVSSLCVPPVLFDRALSVLSDLGILVAAGVHFDVSGPVLYPGGDSVRAGPHLLMAGDTSDGDWFPVTTAMRPLTGGFVCCGWL